MCVGSLSGSLSKIAWMLWNFSGSYSFFARDLAMIIP